MTCSDRVNGSLGVILAILFAIIPKGCLSQLVVSAAGPTHTDALVGDTVTLAVSYSGALNPAIIWKKGAQPIVTWTINSSTAPDIPDNMKHVLRVTSNGSLIFENVTLDFTSSYSVEMTKVGQSTAFTNLTLTVYEIFENVTLSSQPLFAEEGRARFTLLYTMSRGVAEEQSWFFNDLQIKPNSHYSLDPTSLIIHRPARTDTGQYSLTLSNPYSSVTLQSNVTVLYGPDDPSLVTTPDQLFYRSGTSLRLSCKADGFPPPTVVWMFGGQTLPNTTAGVLNLNNVKTGQGGEYTCSVTNDQTSTNRLKNRTIKVYEKPSGGAVCSVKAVANAKLQYECSWPGGTPPALLSFPELTNSSGAGHFSVNVTAAAGLSGTAVSCTALHPVQPSTCNVTASRPAPFLPTVRFGVSAEGKIRVTIGCVTLAVPKSVVSWSRGGEEVISGSVHQISPETTLLTIRDYNISVFTQYNYTCICRNPLGHQQGQIQLLGPTISDSGLFSNTDGTVVTLSWEVPPTSIVTGFDIQMLGPDLLRSFHNLTRISGRSDVFRTILQKPGSARSADIFTLDPKVTYEFRIIPRARFTEGQPSPVHRIGPGGLSGSAIAGIAAGVPAAVIVLLVLLGLLLLFIHSRNDDNEQARYPVTNIEKGVKTKAELASNNMLMAGGLMYPPDFIHLTQAAERSVTLPSFVPPPPVRVATTV